MEIIRKFKGLGKNDSAIAGGKGASLGEMTNAGIPVPPGFVVLSESFEKFLDETDLNVEIEAILKKVDHEKISTVENASEQIQTLILNADFPKDIASEIQKNFKALGAQFVAVRSSATSEDSASAAWAGQLDSYLNTTQKELLKNVKRCWASLFTPRAIFYRFEKNLNLLKISVAVVIQKMVQSEVSGIAFSVHPVTQDYNQIIIEAGFGLGEAIVSGSITPDSYVIEKQPRQIIDKNITIQEKGLYKTKQGGSEWVNLLKVRGSKQALTDKEILELVEIILRIENHYGFPCDIEWAREKGKFYIVQSRPITTLNKQIKKSSDAKNNLSNQKLILEKSIARDWSLLNCQIWHKVQTQEFKKQFGWGYTEVVYENSDGNITTFRAPTEHIHGLVNLVTNQINANVNWINKKSKELINLSRQINQLIDKNKKVSSYNNKQLNSLLVNLFNLNVKMGPLFLIALWFPNHMENSPLNKKYSTYIKKLIAARIKTEKTVPETDSLLRKICSEIALRNNLRLKLSAYLGLTDCLDLLKNNKPANIKNKLLRRRKYFILTNNGILNDKLENYSKNKNFSIKKDEISDTKELKGSSAYPGLVIGQVKIIKNKQMFSKFKKGNILVASSTTPDFLPVMNQAKAFITDEGGITCHAAIVAREMKKPCIIGTKIATQILHDGDLVEVDANNGIVKILK